MDTTNDWKPHPLAAKCKPCPFCGCTDVNVAQWDDVKDPQWMVYCLRSWELPLCAGMVSGLPTARRAVNAWNRRTPQT